MANPFDKRATEFLSDDGAFLSVVAPDPITSSFASAGQKGTLYDRLVRIIGTPGSGKTTLARVFALKTVGALLRNPNAYKEITAALTATAVLENRQLRIAGCRLPMESEYRDFWELPYAEHVRLGLMENLIQARAVLGWLRGLEALGIPEDVITVQHRSLSNAALEAIGGETGTGLRKRAEKIEKAVYGVSAALVPPPLEELPEDATLPYHPFNVLSMLRAVTEEGELSLKPLVILDDTHALHPRQFNHLMTWLSRREIPIARWMMTRLDALDAQDVLFSQEDQGSFANLEPGRDYENIWLQGEPGNYGEKAYKTRFCRMARTMANRYLQLMPVMERRKLVDFERLLSNDPKNLPEGKCAELREEVKKRQFDLDLPQNIYSDLARSVNDYLRKSKSFDKGTDLELQMLLILMERFVRRIPQRDLFTSVEEEEPEASEDLTKRLNVNSALADGARVHLMHRFGRPYYYGISGVCGASGHNAQQFLRLSRPLVDLAETRAVRQKGDKPVLLTAADQDKRLIEQAKALIEEWSFPEVEGVRNLVRGIGAWCVSRTLEENAPLGGGATGVGVPQVEFERMARKRSRLAQVLHFAVAYNAVEISQRRLVKHKEWTTIELGGAVRVAHGLTLLDGGFVEKRVQDLENLIAVEEH